MSKVRVYEVAKQLNLDPKAVVTLFQSIGLTDVRNHMSSVDVDAVERVKRHLEKQKTHDTVEERIRPTVVKRRAVAKPEDAPPSTAMTDVASRQKLSDLTREAPASRSDLDAPRERESVRNIAASTGQHEYLEERQSVRNMRVEDRPSERHISSPQLAIEPIEPMRDVAPAAVVPPARVSEPRIPVAAPSVREVAGANVAAAPESVREVAAAPATPAAAAAAPAAIPAPAAVVEAPPVQAVPSVPSAQPQAASAQPSTPPAAATPSTAPAAPPRSTAPKTGIEVWAGRPGVPVRRYQYVPGAPSNAPGARPTARGGPQMRGPGGNRFGNRGRPGFNAGIPRPKPAVSTQEMGAHKKVVRIEGNITLSAMAARMSLKAPELLMKLLSMGMSGVHINTTLDADTAKILASDFGWEVEDVEVSEEASLAAARGEVSIPVEADPNDILRPPVVTVMGHVDHGKTSLLDKIRKANVAGGEAGGITQHIGAYKVQTANGTIVFLDTPGHEAFTQMRARGASVTDIVVLVVAADDGVMPQTKEAVVHAKQAKVPIIVAVNKCDKPGAEPERVRRELVEIGLQPEDWGGDTIFVNVSAMTGDGIPQLLEMLALQAEVLDLKANPKKGASGTVIEALLDRGRGPVARVLVQDGTLRVGDFVLCGQGFGKVRAMTNEHGKQVHEAGPSTPVEILGLSDVPGAGDSLDAVKDPKKAQEIAESRRGKSKNMVPMTGKISLEELSKRIAESGVLELRVIIKGDVQGSVEAVSEALTKLSTDRVKLSVVFGGVGAINENDVNLAIASRAMILGFNVRPAGKAQQVADQEKIEIRQYTIIYNAVDDVKNALEGLLPATLVEKLSGKAEVRAIFKIRGVVVAGCYVIEGVVKRSNVARLVRDGVVVWTGKLDALKRFKDDAKDVPMGFECGISLEAYSDMKEKDIIESFEVEEVKQKL